MRDYKGGPPNPRPTPKPRSQPPADLGTGAIPTYCGTFMPCPTTPQPEPVMVLRDVFWLGYFLGTLTGAAIVLCVVKWMGAG